MTASAWRFGGFDETRLWIDRAELPFGERSVGESWRGNRPCLFKPTRTSTVGPLSALRFAPKSGAAEDTSGQKLVQFAQRIAPVV